MALFFSTNTEPYTKSNTKPHAKSNTKSNTKSNSESESSHHNNHNHNHHNHHKEVDNYQNRLYRITEQQTNFHDRRYLSTTCDKATVSHQRSIARISKC